MADRDNQTGGEGSFRDLRVWQEAKALASTVYEITDDFPTHERYALADQMRRAATSVYANIAEGSGRSSRADFARFLSFAWASLRELDAHVDFAQNVDLMTADGLQTVRTGIRRVGQLLSGLRRYLR